MNKFFSTKTIAGLGVLTAMVVALQILSNYVQFGPISITLALFPIAVGAMLYGPIGGLFLGLVDGAMVLLAPSTISGFFAISPLGTIVTCLLKTGLAGLIAGFLFSLYKKQINVELVCALILLPLGIVAALPDIYTGFLLTEPWGIWLSRLIRFIIMGALVLLVFKGLVRPSLKSVVILTSISVPIINTGLFSIAALTIFNSTLMAGANSAGKSGVYFLLFVWIGWNFFLEFAINAALAPAFHNVYKSIEKKFSRKA